MPAVARGRAGLAWTLIAVVAAGLMVTAVLAVVTFRGHQRAEGRLLALQTRLIAAAGQAADQLYVEDHLGGAATLAAATDGNVMEFGKAMASAVTATGPFVSGRPPGSKNRRPAQRYSVGKNRDKTGVGRRTADRLNGKPGQLIGGKRGGSGNLRTDG